MGARYKAFTEVALFDGPKPVVPYPMQEEEGGVADTVHLLVKEGACLQMVSGRMAVDSSVHGLEITASAIT